MKPGFTLNLSHDGIGLLHRAGPGWFTVGEVSLDDADLAGALARLRRTALELEPKGLTSKLIVPDTQILYSEIEAPGPDAAARRAQIAAALEGRTPYAVEDLVFDWSGHGDVVQVAVVARDTLAEAEEFAETYGFCPVAFVASPAPGKFGGEPFFGLTSRAAQHLPEGARLDRDQDPVRPGGVIRAPIAAVADALAEAPAEPVAEIEAEAPPAPEMTAPPEPTPAVVAEPEPAPEVEPEPEAPAEPEPEPEATTPEPEPEIAADPEGSEAPKPVAEAATEPAPEAAPVPAPKTLEALPLEALPAEVATDTAAPSPSPAPEMTDAEALPAEADAPQAHESQAASPDAPQAVAEAEAEAEADAPLPEAEAVTEAPFVAVDEPEADEPAPDAHTGIPDNATAPAAEAPSDPEKGTGAEDLPPAPSEALADPKGPALGQTAARIPPLAPLGTAGARRLGGAGARDSLPPLPQGKRLSLDGSATDASVVAPGLALPKEDPPQPAKPARRGGVKKAKAEARARFVSAARSTAALGGAAGKALARGLANRTKAKPETPAAPVAGKAPATAGTTDPDRTVFGGRKLQPVGGKPKFLGVALTLGLLIFMGIVVLWSSFLGDSAPEPQQIASTEQPSQDPAAPPETDIAQPDPAPPAPEAQMADAVPEEAPAPVAAEPPADAEPDPAEPVAPPVEAPETWGEQAGGNAQSAPQPDLSAVSSSTDPGRPATSETTLPPVESLVTDAVPAPLPLPAPFEQLARLNPDGEIEPTPQGVAMPGGFTLYSGQPDLVPAPRPEAVTAAAIAAARPAPAEAEGTPAAQDAPATEAAPYTDPALSGFRPAARPAAIVPAAPAPEEAAPDTGAPAEDDGAALAPASAEELRLAALKPRARPQAVAIANTRLAEQRAAEEAAAEASRAAMESATTLAVAVSRRPPSKPRDFSNAVAAAVAAAVAETTIRVSAPAPEPAPAPAPKQAAAAAPEPEEIDEPEPVAAAPKVPTSASVAKQATQKNVLNLGKMNLIGLYGSSNKRRALVRMPNGRFVKVSVGDRLDGGRVTGIGDSELTYQKGGRNIVLKLLKGS